MRIFLLWNHLSNEGRKLVAERVASKLQDIFSPLFGTPLSVTIQQTVAMTMVFAELPVRGWKPPFFQEDEQGWACAVDYPIDARAVLAANDSPFGDDNVLPTLGRSLQANPLGLLRDMAPPFSLIWSSKEAEETFIQNDGLGQAQIFEYEDGHLWALTNKIFALKALGVNLEFVPEDWAVRVTLGWFPSNLTGYKNVRFLPSGTQLKLDHSGLRRTRFDALSDWVNPAPLREQDSLELARCSVLKQIRAAMPLWEQADAGLTGGYDTRAVVCSLRVAGAQFQPRVKGHQGNYDVTIAMELARIAGLPLSIERLSELPAEDVETSRRSITQALLWQAGYINTDKHKSFLARELFLKIGGVNIMGQDGALCRGVYVKKINALAMDPREYEKALVNKLTKTRLPLVKKHFRAYVVEVITEAYRVAEKHRVTGLPALEFFFLYERIRRWGSGVRSSQTGQIVAPLLNPDFIRATYAHPGHGREFEIFHKYIIERHAPEWATIAYDKDFERRVESEDPGQSSWKTSNGKQYYNSLRWWKSVGYPLVENALEEGGLWNQVFEPDLVSDMWQLAPDELVMMHLLPCVVGSEPPAAVCR